jgi:glycosyltransferase involved in cell wall biosynthesis
MPTPAVDVTVVVPAHNAAAFIEETLVSVLDQDWPALDVVVVDAGSSDGTPEIADRLGDRVRVLEVGVSPPSAARNRGIEVATGTFVALLDHDDRWLPRSLRRRMAGFDDQSVGLVHGGWQVFEDESDAVTAVCPGMPVHDVHDLIRWNHVAPSTVVMRRAVIESVGGFNEQFAVADDWELWRRLADVTKFGFVPGVHSEWRLRAKSVSHADPRVATEVRELVRSGATFHDDCVKCRRASRYAAHILRRLEAGSGGARRVLDRVPDSLAYRAAITTDRVARSLLGSWPMQF